MSDQNITKSLFDCQGCPSTIGVYSGFDGFNVYSGVLRCNSWTCPYCGPRKLKVLRKRMLDGDLAKLSVPKYGLKFATLTFGGNDIRRNFIIYDRPSRNIFPTLDQTKEIWEDSKKPQTTKYYDRRIGQMVTGPRYDLTKMYEIMMQSFNKLRTALTKRYGKFMYFRVYEPHQDGVPHLHVLFAGDAVIPKSFLDTMSKLWAKYGLGFVRLSSIKDKNGKVIRNFKGVQHAINYLLKYMTKDVKKAGRYKRVFSCSQNTLMPIEKKDWRRMKIIMGTVEDNGKDFKEEVIFDSEKNSDPSLELEKGIFGSEEELKASEAMKGFLDFDGDFVKVPSDIIAAIMEVHISQLTQPTINIKRKNFKNDRKN